MFPREKYKIIVNKNEVIAISTYGGRPVRGIAKCDPRDEFDVEKGKDLAIARCAAKVAIKRQNRAIRKHQEAIDQYNAALAHLHDMDNYSTTAILEASAAIDDLFKIEKEM